MLTSIKLYNFVDSTKVQAVSFNLIYIITQIAYLQQPYGIKVAS